MRSYFKYRTIWISDIHLATKDCKAEFLLDFLKYTESEKLYLVGDIIDGWKIKKGFYWPQSHSDVIQKIMRKARKGTDVIYIPGNHDEFARDYTDLNFANIQVKQHAIHETAKGQKLLIMHGDEFDSVMKYAPWLAYIGDSAYYVCLRLNDLVNKLRAKMGYSYWSLSAYLKHKVKKTVEHISKYEDFLVDMAKKHHVDGIVCGHIHHAEMKDIKGILYCNDGDWVESCTALVEHMDGTLEIIDWVEEMNKYTEAYRASQTVKQPEPVA